jgi:hypothetical protein
MGVTSATKGKKKLIPRFVSGNRVWVVLAALDKGFHLAVSWSGKRRDYLLDLPGPGGSEQISTVINGQILYFVPPASNGCRFLIK